MAQVFEQLKHKYQSALNLMQPGASAEHQYGGDEVVDSRRGTVAGRQKQSQIKLIDASFNDLICDLSVSQQQPTAAQSPATMTAGASVSGGQN